MLWSYFRRKKKYQVEEECCTWQRIRQAFSKKSKNGLKSRITLLGGYLPQYFQKVLLTKRPIYYVDCFAGKGRFDDGQDGSPMIAAQSISKSIKNSKLEPTLLQNAIRPYFIELNHADELRENMKTAPFFPGKYEVISGKFEEKICGILHNRKGDNVFLYIDPYGIKELDSQLFATIQGFEFRSFEMLINFNSFGFSVMHAKYLKLIIAKIRRCRIWKTWFNTNRRRLIHLPIRNDY